MHHTDEELVDKLLGMSHVELVKIWRFEGSGSPYITRESVFNILKEQISKFGGFTPEVSKAVGWER
jgi:hypothetical protein